MWQFILSSDCPIYHIFVSTATRGWIMVPLGTGRPRASSAQRSRSLERVTYQSCGGTCPNVVSGLSDTRQVPTDIGKTRGSALRRGHTRRGCAERPRLRPSLGCDAAAQAATRAHVAAVASAGARPPSPPRTKRQWGWPTAVPTAALTTASTAPATLARRRPPPPPHPPQPPQRSAA